MKLRFSSTSPFVRKVRIVAAETGLDGRIALVPSNPWAADTDLVLDNPLSKVPALVTEGGEVLYDSPVICEYLDSLHDGQKLLPAAGGARWRQIRLQALADGIMEAGVAIRVETVIRPAEARWPGWCQRQHAAIARGLDALEAEASGWEGAFLIGPIAVAAALDWLTFRSLTDWRLNHPALAAWRDGLGERPSLASTAHRE